METIEVKILTELAYQEILVAQLSEIGFNAFLEEENYLLAYTSLSDFKDLEFKQLMESHANKIPISYSLKSIKEKNWNATWESNFKPIKIENKLYIRAPFHEKNNEVEQELIIIPKMSFGTGHHETTEQCLRHQINIDHKNKRVLDVGTGTGILAIYAEKLGAKEILAFDIDTWSVENTKENISLNNCKNIAIQQATIDDIKPGLYDIVIANINKNILLSEIEKYSHFMAPKAHLILSGFYKEDLVDIENLTLKSGLKKIDEKYKNNWGAVVFIKE